jgi:hypothetical protein
MQIVYHNNNKNKRSQALRHDRKTVWILESVFTVLRYKVVEVIERTWWRLFQKRVVLTKFDIYVFIT